MARAATADTAKGHIHKIHMHAQDFIVIYHYFFQKISTQETGPVQKTVCLKKNYNYLDQFLV